MGKGQAFFEHNKVDTLPLPSIPSQLYKNTYVANIPAIYSNVVNKYIPRILAKMTKYNLIHIALIKIGINYKWLVMLLLLIL